jgi:hypothetical protein
MGLSRRKFTKEFKIAALRQLMATFLPANSVHEHRSGLSYPR